MSKLTPSVTQTDNQTGNVNAPITLLEFGDYQCPHCGFAFPIVQKLLEDFGHQFRFVFRHFPIQEIHPLALTAALSAEAAGVQGKYWKMHEMIFQNQNRFETDVFLEFAKALSLDIDLFQKNINDPKGFTKVDSDFKSGLRSGVNGTPSFFINDNKIELVDISYKTLKKAMQL